MDSQAVDRQLALARQALTPSTAVRDRVHTGVLAAGPSTPAASALALAQALSSAGPWAALRASGKTGAALGLALLAFGFGAGQLASSMDRVPPPLPPAPAALASSDLPVLVPPAVESVQAATPVQGDAVVEAARDGEPSAPPRERAARARVARANPAVIPPAPSVAQAAPEGARAPTAADPSAELTLLQRAERAVRTENPALARALTDEHAARFPGSSLGEEREAIEHMAQCQAEPAAASDHAARFLREHPLSVYASRLRELCGMQPAPAPPER